MTRVELPDPQDRPDRRDGLAPMLNVTRTRSPARSVQPMTRKSIPPTDTSQHCAIIGLAGEGRDHEVLVRSDPRVLAPLRARRFRSAPGRCGRRRSDDLKPRGAAASTAASLRLSRFGRLIRSVCSAGSVAQPAWGRAESRALRCAPAGDAQPERSPRRAHKTRIRRGSIRASIGSTPPRVEPAGTSPRTRKRPRCNTPRAFTFPGARDRTRTGDPHVGNVALYQLSYSCAKPRPQSQAARGGSVNPAARPRFAGGLGPSRAPRASGSSPARA